WAEANAGTASVAGASVRLFGAASRRGFFSDIKDAFKDATSVVIGFANDALQTIIRIGDRVLTFVLDTAAKVATFVEAIIEKVVSSIKQFIEFLRFLFDWEDITKTQRFLVASINNAFDYAADLVDSAKGPVAEFIDDLQEGIEDGINGLIRQLGGDPDADDEGPGLPEAAEWFLNLILGESRGSDNEATVQETTASDGSVADSLQDAFNNILEALRDAVGIGAEIADGMIDTIEAFVKNPLRPELALIEILETIRNVGIKVLDLGQELIFAFFDILIAAVKLFKVVLNAKIRLPLISRLFEMIGGGDLTILNVLGLLVAIPTTIIHKLIFGEAPFREVLPPVLADQPVEDSDPAVIASGNLLSLNSSESAVQSDDDKERTKRKIRGFGGLALTADLINGIITTGLDAFPEQGDDDGKGTFILEFASIVLSWASWLGSFPASPSEPGGYPYALHKHKVTKTNDKTAYRQRVMWGWRTALLSLDTMYLLMALKKHNSQEMPIQRLGRADDFSAFMLVAFTLIDLELTGLYLATLPQGKSKRLEVANEVIGLLPNLFCFVRHSGPKGAIALAVLDGVTAITNFGLGIKLLIDAVDAVDE
ncbi:MAG: hypothetical protein MUF38_18155, partial [Anaerolineae bacterium]|nr:hypothetical protein [Anaerolineae bacterium]